MQETVSYDIFYYWCFKSIQFLGFLCVHSAHLILKILLVQKLLVANSPHELPGCCQCCHGDHQG